MRIAIRTLFIAFITLTSLLPARDPAKSVSKVLKVMGAAHEFAPRANGEDTAFATYFGGTKTLTPTRTAADPDGNYYVAGSVAWQTTADTTDVDAFVAKLNSAGDLVYTLYFGGDGTDRAEGIAIDASGRVYLAGFTNSANFPSVSGYQPDKHGLGDAFACRLTPAGGFDYCTFLGGGRDDHGFAIAVDAAGSAYIAGTTYSGDYPVTPDAFQTSAQPWDTFGWPSDVFVTKLSPDGRSLLYSTYLGGKSVVCVGGSRCVGAASHDNAGAIAVDSEGNAYVAGVTNSSDFPTTEGAYQTQCRCDYFSSDLFVTKLNPTGSALVYSTYIGGRAPQQRMPEESLGAMALDAEGNVYLAGGTGSLGGNGGESYPTTPGVLEPEVTYEDTEDRIPVPFVTKLNPEGSALVYSTFLTGQSIGMVNGLSLGPDGQAYLSGTTESADFPVSEGAFSNGREFHSRLSADATTLLYSTQLPAGFGGRDILLSAAARVCLLGASAYFSCTPAEPVQIPPVLGMANSAGSVVTGKISGGELITFLGPAIGPDEPAGLQIGEDGKVTSELGDTRVLIDGVPAPMIYAQKDMINCVVPVVLATSSPVAEIVHAGDVVATLHLTRMRVQPGVFRQPSSRFYLYPAAINQDGTIHSEENPAPVGSIVAIYATGLGGTHPMLEDGAVVGDNLPQVLGDVRVLGFNGEEMEVVYAGQAPNMVAGVMQVNFRVTPNPPRTYPVEYTLYLEVDGMASEPFAIATVP